MAHATASKQRPRVLRQQESGPPVRLRAKEPGAAARRRWLPRSRRVPHKPSTRPVWSQSSESRTGSVPRVLRNQPCKGPHIIPQCGAEVRPAANSAGMLSSGASMNRFPKCSSSSIRKRIGSCGILKVGNPLPTQGEAGAWRSSGSISRTRLALADHFTLERISASWSISCKAPRLRSTVAVAPPSNTTGDCARRAFCTAVSVLVTPGPAVTAATPGIPLSRATASAANTAVASCRVSTTRRPARLAPTRIGEMCPRHSVNRKRTPCAFSTRPMISPPFMIGPDRARAALEPGSRSRPRRPERPPSSRRNAPCVSAAWLR